MSANKLKIRRGDDFKTVVILKKQVNGHVQQFNLPDTATVTAELKSHDKNSVYINPVTLSGVDSGSDWARSNVAVSFTEIQTAAITKTGAAQLVIKITDGDDTRSVDLLVEVL